MQKTFSVILILLFSTISNSQANFEANRVLELEEEVRTLIGKVELLEHQMRLLQGGKGSANVSEPNLSDMAKRTTEPTLPLGSSQSSSSNITQAEEVAPKQEEAVMVTAPAPSTSSLISQYDEAESNQFLAKQEQSNAAAEQAEALQAPQKEKKQSPPPRKMKGEREMYEIALASYKEKNYIMAQKNLEAFIAQYSKSSLVSNAYFWLGESYYKQNYNENAAVQYLKSYKSMPTGGKAADALLMLSFSLNKLGKNEEACAMLVRLEQEFPKRPTSSLKRAADAKLKFACPKS